MGAPGLYTRVHDKQGSRPNRQAQDLRTGDRWLDSRLSQFSFRGLMTVVATAFIPLPWPAIVSMMVKLESSHWLGKNIVPSTKETPGKYR